MREHGVIRRALLVCAETVSKLRQRASSVDAAALRQTARLFRTFGEDYHEKLLEEQHIFPIVRKQGGASTAFNKSRAPVGCSDLLALAATRFGWRLETNPQCIDFPQLDP